MKKQYYFIISVIIFSILFWVSRIPLLTDYGLINYSGDASGYLQLADEMLQGILPDFDDRTPGYPMFIVFSKIFSGSYTAIIYW